MRRLLFLTVVLLLAHPLPGGAQEEPTRKVLSSGIAAVTVYADRAVVTRTGRMTLSVGRQLLVFRNLPAGLFDNSVRVTGEAAGARILDVRVETAFLDTLPQERIASLQAQLRDLETKQQEINDRSAVANTQREFILQIKAQSADNISRDLKLQRPTVEDWQKVLVFIDGNLTRILADLRQLAKSRSDLQEKIDAVQRQIGAIGPGQRKAVKNVLVDIEASKAGDARLTLVYAVVGARWNPRYDVRVSTDAQTAALAYDGVVRQNTGEDWINVELSLSTARPDIGGTKPELSPWYVFLRQQAATDATASGRAKTLEKRARIPAIEMKAAEPPEELLLEMEAPVAAVEAQATSALFRITSRADVASDNVPQKVTIALETLHGSFSYAAVPKLAPHAYLKASMKNSTDYTFLPGAANIFADESFVSTSMLTPVFPGDSFDVFLGVDPSVKVERRLVNRLTEYTGTFTKHTKITYEYSLSVENTKKTEQRIMVQDQLPVSQNENIVVEQLEPPVGTLRPNDQGVLLWDLRLLPAEKRRWKLRFSVEFPQGMPIVGLE